MSETNSPQKGSSDFEPSVYDSTKAFVVGIAGGTASGKTTLSNKIQAELQEDIVHFSFDSFYKGLQGEPNADNYDFDHPNALDFDRAYECLKMLKNKQTTKIPVYDFVQHMRVPDKHELMEAKNIVIIEGILSFYDTRIRDLMDFKIFVHCDADVALCRRLKRDIKERGRDYVEVLKRYNRFVRTGFQNFVKPYMKYADIIIPGGADNTVGLNFILDNLKTQKRKMLKHMARDAHNKATTVVETLLKPYEVVQSQSIANLKFEFNYQDQTILLLKGLLQSFKPQYFMFKELIETDFGESYDTLKDSIRFSDMRNLLVSKRDKEREGKIRAHVIYAPFFFKEDITFKLDQLPSSLKREIKEPKYLLCIFTDYQSLKGWLNLLPIFKLIPIFIVSSKQELESSISDCLKSDGKNLNKELQKLLKKVDSGIQDLK